MAATVLCSIPVGLVALYHASRVTKHWDAGREDRAWRSSTLALGFTWAAAALGAAVLLLVVALG